MDERIAFRNMILFADIVGLIENDGKLKGTNRPQKGKKGSTAKGLYQFVDQSVPPAMRRLRRHVDYDWVREDANPNDLTWNQQTMMFIADVLEKKGSDKLMRRVMEDANDTEAIKQAYYQLHHTKPDANTKKRTERILSAGLRKYLEEVNRWN